jgi:tetratricopeptide (TPR) repeat protein
MINHYKAEVRHVYTLIYSGCYSAAIEALDGLIQAEPQQPRWLGEKLALLSDRLRCLEFSTVQMKLMQQFPGTAEAKLAEALTPGIAAMDRLHLLEAAIQLDPNFVKLYYYHAQTLHWLNMDHQALQDYDQCLRLAPDFYEIYFWRAKTYQARGLSQKAISDLMVYYNSPICRQRTPLYNELIGVLQQMKKLDMAFDAVFNKHCDCMQSSWDQSMEREAAAYLELIFSYGGRCDMPEDWQQIDLDKS